MDNSRSDKGSDDESEPEEQDPFKDSSSDSDGEGNVVTVFRYLLRPSVEVKGFLVVASKTN